MVRRILYTDPIWAAYAIADLQPHLAGDCRWLAAEGTNGGALALIYSGLQPPVLLTMGDPALLAPLLAGADLPPAIYVSIRDEHLPVVARHYDLSGDTRPMWRMTLADTAAAVQPPALSTSGDVVPVRLSGADVTAVLRLLAHGGPFCPDAFSPAQMEAGVFYGVYAGADLLAVGGTHVLDDVGSVAAIGNMYTRPDARRRGYSALILAAIVRELLAQAISTIVLNVDQRNISAQALYLARGFVVHTPYLEGTGLRHA